MSKKKHTISALERLVRHHNHLYFIEKRPEISDYDFDGLVEELRQRKPSSPVLQEIGSDLSDISQKIRHSTPMLSLDKAYDEKTMANWASKFSGKVIASPKIDGMAVSIKYGPDGDLVQAATRGNGMEGELITGNVLEIKDLPKKIRLKGVEIRGEVYMALSVFKKYSAEFANPRNLTAGAIKQKDPKKTAEYNLSFLGYDILGKTFSTEVEKREQLQENNIPTVEWLLIERQEIESIFANFLKKRDKYDFETDGVVYKANDLSEQVRLGSTAHHPRFAIAYKFQGDSGETTLIDVEWSVSRTGAITPVAIVEPVELSGAMVSRASLHNLGLVKKLGLTKGAKVVMMRRGGVIPNLENVIMPGREKIVPPEKCPSCSFPVEIKDDFLYCTNKKGCMKTKVAELVHFIKTIECDGFGEKIIKQLYDNHLVTEPSDFYTLTKDDLMNLERMGDKLAEKLIRNINDKRDLSLDTFLRSLGIRELGRHVAVILAVRYKTIDKIFKVKSEDLASIHTIGEVIAGHVIEGLKSKREPIEKLLKEVRLQEMPAESAVAGPLSGRKVLFTGSMVTTSRKEAQHIVEAGGGYPVTSISKDVDFLVVGDGGGAGSKLTKAKKPAHVLQTQA